MRSAEKYKFIAAVAALFLIPFLILSGHFTRLARESEGRNALAAMSQRTRIAANTAAGLLAEKYNTSGLITAKEFLSATGSERKKILEKTVKAEPNIYSELSVLGLTGREVIKTGALASKELKDYSQTELFKSLMPDNASLGAVEYGEYTPPSLVLIEPFGYAGSKPSGYLLSRLSLVYFGEIARSMGKFSRGNIGFIDSGGQLICDSLGLAVMKPGSKASPEVLRMVELAVTNGMSDLKNEAFLQGHRSFVSVSAIAGTRWWAFEISDAAGGAGDPETFWIKRIVLTGIILILVFAYISYKLAGYWLTKNDSQPQL